MRGFVDQRGPDLAAAVAFASLFSLVPLVVVLTLLGTTLFGDEGMGFYRLLGFALPVADDAFLQRLKDASASAQGVLGGAALFFLAPTLRAYFLLEGAADTLWGVVERRSFPRRLLLAIVVSVVGPSLLGLGTSLVLRSGVDFSEFRFLPILTATPLLALVYKALVGSKVRWGPALTAGAFGAVGLGLLKWGFGRGVGALAGIGRVYGTISWLFVFLVAVGVASGLFLFGVSLAHAIQFRKELLAHDDPHRIERRAGPLHEAVRLLLVLARAHEQGLTGVGLAEVAAEIRRTEDEARSRVNRLIAAGLVHGAEGERYVLTRDPEEISLYTVARAVGAADPFVLPAGDDTTSETLRKVYRRADREIRGVLQGTSLEDLARKAPKLEETTGIFERK